MFSAESEFGVGGSAPLAGPQEVVNEEVVQWVSFPRRLTDHRNLSGSVFAARVTGKGRISTMRAGTISSMFLSSLIMGAFPFKYCYGRLEAITRKNVDIFRYV